MSEWIEITDRLPPDDTNEVLAVYMGKHIEIVYGCLLNEAYQHGSYTHWMELPGLPNNE